MTRTEKTTPLRFITAASLFDGHDAAINIIRRILQQAGVEVVHLGHNRSVDEVVRTAIQEDADAIAVSSYQGGHMEYFKYMVDRLRDLQACHVQIFGGGGGVIVEREIKELEAYGVTKIFSPEDGMRMGLEGMVKSMLENTDGKKDRNVEIVAASFEWNNLTPHDLARILTLVEEGNRDLSWFTDRGMFNPSKNETGRLVIGITGTGGAGKSTLVDELVRRFLNDFADIRIAILSVDPSRRRTGGALLGDRIRMNSLYGDHTDRVYMRSFGTRQLHRSVTATLPRLVGVCRLAGFDLIIIETAGIGQSDTEIVDLSDISVYVMTQEFGAPSQLEKIGMLDLADFIVLNKFDRRGSPDALRDIRKQVQRNRGLWNQDPASMPVFPVVASRFEDPGVTRLYLSLLTHIQASTKNELQSTIYRDLGPPNIEEERYAIIPPKRQAYLGEIVDVCRAYRQRAEEQANIATKWGQAAGVIEQLEEEDAADQTSIKTQINQLKEKWWNQLDEQAREILLTWDDRALQYRQEQFTYTVRKRRVSVPLEFETLSGTKLRRVVFPEIKDPGERVRFGLLENLPGYFPFTAGVFPFKRTTEDPTRMFAGEGSPERTNRRFHLLAEGMPAKRLSTAFDSVTLYGADPSTEPDVYGKIGNAGVSICTLDDMKKLYSGFNLCDPTTSVSMTINGPAPMILAMFMNTAIDQQVELYLREVGSWEEVKNEIQNRHGGSQPQYTPFGPGGRLTELPQGHDGSGLGLLGTSGSQLVKWGLLPDEHYHNIRSETFQTVRGTVQADILKEDQAQNTCIFSTEFALRLMGDVQQYFIDHKIQNYYSVSISGYHIAEAGANPITQLAFTLANGFTYVEYYLARGMDVDAFAQNLSFFFSNGMDAEYSVLGRVARRIWSVVMRDRYGANERSQKLKYHIQTSGRSLHAKEMQFNDIRTTLQALTAIYDNCNSLHTNAYDEAITTPTEESVRRAMAIQLIINKESGLVAIENPLQGSFIINELTDLVEEAVLRELDAINARGGVLGAMETMYQRGRIQDESLLYERKKHTGELPVIGVNTFLGKEEESEKGDELVLMRSSEEEKMHQTSNLQVFQERHAGEAEHALDRLRTTARKGENVFEVLMDVVTVCSLGQITRALFDIGGQYRRSM